MGSIVFLLSVVPSIVNYVRSFPAAPGNGTLILQVVALDCPSLDDSYFIPSNRLRC